jgi:outer membrane protein assembly factor BamA
MADLLVDLPDLRSEHTFLEFYLKYENSPLMDYYGPGTDSRQEDRTSYRLEDTDILGRFGYVLHRKLRGGAYFGWLKTNVGPGQRSGVPSTHEVFGPDTTPGIDQQTNHWRFGGFLEFDNRDFPNAATSGGRYFLGMIYNFDSKLRKHSYYQLNLALEQHIPWANHQRVLALRLGSSMTFTDQGQTVPFYREPTLGGNEWLRGYERYRFHDQNSVIFTAEHRWYVFSGLRAALFFEAGKVAPRIRELTFSDLKYSGGIGFRFKFQDAVFMRIDQAFSPEGSRFMWTFNKVF